MFKKISLLAALLVLLAGAQAFAQSNAGITSFQSRETISGLFHKIDLASQETPKQLKKTVYPAISAYILPGGVIFFFLVVFTGYWFVFRKRHL
ncbi:hypothetical protein ACQYAD_01955 [Neobacillus sp. SM06]|uniref:hypothetical protein n=1 Tax=Neobacillus sp. SM06 TaxID=3422492 RepID=UPI003D2C84B5